ncbi:MAG TPA: aminotransferase class V-fold PLP-dependent enzyme [Longimicrobiales bacterium]|jgi:cysteine desulfurase family protein
MRHYLDFAATSAIRPRAVAEAVAGFLAAGGGTPGRGGHAEALDAGRMVLRCRRAVLEILGLPDDPTRVAFFQNATQALNTALWGALRARDVLVVSSLDHNSILRPADALARERGIEVRMIQADPEGRIDLQEAERLLEGARMVVVNAVSNVLGVRLPVASLAELAHRVGALVLVDAAQSAGHVETTYGPDGADLVAFTGHKGLLGPQGTGGLWVRAGVDVDPLIRGGTGGNSLERDMPAAMPDRLEAGTSNAPGLAGLLAGCEHVLAEGVGAIHNREATLKARLREGLAGVPGIRLISPSAPDGVGIVTLVADAVSPDRLAARLDRDFQVSTRAGLHCAPEAHRVAGTAGTGALRLSLGWASTEADVDRAIEGIRVIVGPTSVPVA